MSDNEETFATALQRAREAKGWSQEQLGHMVGLTQQAVARWEGGKGMPRPSMRKRLYELFGHFWPEHRLATIDRLEDVPHYTERVRVAAAAAVPLFQPRKEADVWKEVLQHVPDELHQHMRSNRQDQSSSAFDYESDRLVLEIKTQGRPMMPMPLIQTWLWRLSSCRLEQGKDRAYALVVVVPDTIDAFRPDRRRRQLEAEAELHGLIFRTVTRPEVIADLIRSAEGISRS
ncbi:MAG: XRE family transcriptional regulator [Proteobacteria bacterium]|nr:MAG: XRE family transcriptional regulator [Pseudomonadota bacterium]